MTQVQYWETAERTYRQHLEKVSLIVHPWRLFDSTPQTSQEVERRLHAEIDALTAFNLCASAYPADPGFRQEMGQAADRVGEISPAVKRYNDGDYETALPILWRLYQADHQNEDVRSYLVRAYYDLGVLNLQNNFFDKASRSFADALGVDRNTRWRNGRRRSPTGTRKPPDLPREFVSTQPRP